MCHHKSVKKHCDVTVSVSYSPNIKEHTLTFISILVRIRCKNGHSSRNHIAIAALLSLSFFLAHQSALVNAMDF